MKRGKKGKKRAIVKKKKEKKNDLGSNCISYITRNSNKQEEKKKLDHTGQNHRHEPHAICDLLFFFFFF